MAGLLTPFLGFQQHQHRAAAALRGRRLAEREHLLAPREPDSHLALEHRLAVLRARAPCRGRCARSGARDGRRRAGTPRSPRAPRRGSCRAGRAGPAPPSGRDGAGAAPAARRRRAGRRSPRRSRARCRRSSAPRRGSRRSAACSSSSDCTGRAGARASRARGAPAHAAAPRRASRPAEQRGLVLRHARIEWALHRGTAADAPVRRGSRDTSPRRAPPCSRSRRW